MCYVETQPREVQGECKAETPQRYGNYKELWRGRQVLLMPISQLSSATEGIKRSKQMGMSWQSYPRKSGQWAGRHQLCRKARTYRFTVHNTNLSWTLLDTIRKAKAWKTNRELVGNWSLTTCKGKDKVMKVLQKESNVQMAGKGIWMMIRQVNSQTVQEIKGQTH